MHSCAFSYVAMYYLNVASNFHNYTFRRNMAKRKIDCSLDDIVMEHLKTVKCKKTSKVFGDSCENDHSKSPKKFIKFLKRKDVKKENRIEDDLGFEINFKAFQPEPKVRFLPQYRTAICLNQDFLK